MKFTDKNLKDNNFILYKGVVEDNNHPEKNGKVKVRIYGLHTEKNENSGDDFEFVSTDDLPWAQVLGGTGFGLVSGVGLTSVLRQGTWVWVILENCDPNKPIIIGTITGVNSKDAVGVYSSGKGYVDPDEVYPFPSRSDENDLNRIARNEKLSDQYYEEPCPILGLDTTIHQKIIDTIDVVTATDSVSGADVTQTEATPLIGEYPNIAVLETQSGHVLEFDDSEGTERIRLYHRTGSYIEIKPDGSIIQKSVNEDSFNQYIHMSDVHEHIAKNVKRYIEGNVDEIIDGYVKRKIGGTFDEHIVGLINQQFDDTQNITITKDLNLKVEGNLNWDIGGNIDIKSGGTHTVNNGGNHSVTAPRIDLN